MRRRCSLFFAAGTLFYRMDTSTCFKSLWLAIQQYRDGRTTQNAAQLQRQVEVSGMHAAASALFFKCVY